MSLASPPHTVYRYQDGADDQYLMVEIVDGRVAVRWTFSAGPQEVILDAVAVNDCNWHAIAVQYRGPAGIMTLIVDGIHVRDSCAVASSDSLPLTFLPPSFLLFRRPRGATACLRG